MVSDERKLSLVIVVWDGSSCGIADTME